MSCPLLPLAYPSGASLAWSPFSFVFGADCCKILFGHGEQLVVRTPSHQQNRFEIR